jgi:hypothetical protein
MKQQLNEVRRMQQIAGIRSLNEFFNDPFSSGQPKSEPKASFQGKFTDITNPQEFIKKFNIEPDSPLAKTVAQYIGGYNNFAITNDNGKFNVYKFRQTSQPGSSVGTFNTVEDAKKAVEKMDK